MNRRTRTKALIAAGVVVVGGSLAYWVLYAKPRARLEEQIAAARDVTAQFKTRVSDRTAVQRELKEFGTRTLGKELDTVNHRFRTYLTAIGEACGLAGVVVDQGRPMPQKNPAAGRLPSSVRAAAREQVDFFVINGALNATGTLESVLRAVAMVEAQPWVHRVRGLSIRPAGREGDRFSLKIEVATVFAPDLVEKDGEHELAQPPIESEQLWRPVLAKNMFRMPPPVREAPTEVVVIAAPSENPAPPPPPPPPAYGDWQLRGVIESASGAQAFFVNTRTQQYVTVLVGGRVLDAVLLEVSGESAYVEIGGKRFEVSNGQTLAARRPVG